jgi:hypothetical protein
MKLPAVPGALSISAGGSSPSRSRMLLSARRGAADLAPGWLNGDNCPIADSRTGSRPSFD